MGSVRARLGYVATIWLATVGTGCYFASRGGQDCSGRLYGVEHRTDGRGMFIDSALLVAGRGRVVLLIRDGVDETIAPAHVTITAYPVPRPDSVRARLVNTGSSHSVSLDTLLAGRYVLSSQRIGYFPRRDTVDVRAGFEDSVRVAIRRDATCLTPVVVVSAAP